MNIGQLATFALCVVAVILCSLACAGDNWIEQTSSRGEASIGLWKTCLTYQEKTNCHYFSTGGLGFYNACRAMTIIAVVMVDVAALGYIVAWLAPDSAISKYSGEPYVSAVMLLVLAALMSTAAQTYDNNISDIFGIFEYGWSYFMAYASSAFCFFSIAVIILTKIYCFGRCCENSFQSL